MADTITEPPPPIETARPWHDTLDESRRTLRRRWELASVLSFTHVFLPVVGKELKMSAEEIETALIIPNDSLAKLHITLLKGIPPVHKQLSSPDVWVTSLCKKLAEWWPWVADGEIPLTAGKGDEVSKYKELDPTIRLLMLKALCELRTEQDDLVSYINDALKEGTDVSHFRKSKISENKSGISYWYDGNSVMGYRLYKEVQKTQPKYRRKGCLNLPQTNLEWETLATNLDEFRTVSEELSSSPDVVEGAVCHMIQTEVIPVLEKVEKRRERDLKRKQREEFLLNGNHAYFAQPTRTCRIRKPVKYTFDEFDRSIDEAINFSRGRKDNKVAKNGTKHGEDGKRASDGSDKDSQKSPHFENGCPAFTDQGKQIDDLVVKDSDDQGASFAGISGKTDMKDTDDKNETDDYVGDQNHSNAVLDSQLQNDHSSPGLKVILDGSSDHCPELVRNLRARNRLRQRPTQNSAVDSDFAAAADSVSENSPQNVSRDAYSDRESLEVPDSEDDLRS